MTEPGCGLYKQTLPMKKRKSNNWPSDLRMLRVSFYFNVCAVCILHLIVGVLL